MVYSYGGPYRERKSCDGSHASSKYIETDTIVGHQQYAVV